MFIYSTIPLKDRGIIGGFEFFNTKIYHYADSLIIFAEKFMFNLIFGIMKVLKNGYQVFECSRYGGKHSVSKIYPTWLGCKRVRNRIAYENRYLDCYSYIVERVDLKF